jgi:hypothetical protein
MRCDGLSKMKERLKVNMAFPISVARAALHGGDFLGLGTGY